MIDPRLLESIAARGWPAAECADLGGWRLHASAGKSGRINSCWPHGPPAARADEAIAAVEGWYAARGLTPRFKIVEEIACPSDLSQRLARLGYHSGTRTLTMAGRLSGEPDADAVVLASPTDTFQRLFADPAFGDADDARERLHALARIPPPRGFALIAGGGEPAAIGACAIEDEWAGVMAMRTAPAFRRRGLARRIFRTLNAFAQGAGAVRGYLQVEAANAPAIALYEAEGFVPIYRYEYWTKM